jgi:hypothetical protein
MKTLTLNGGDLVEGSVNHMGSTWSPVNIFVILSSLGNYLSWLSTQPVAKRVHDLKYSIKFGLISHFII